MSDDDAYNDYEDFEGDGFDEEMDSSLLNSSLRGSKDATPFGTADSIRMERCRRTRFPNVPSDDDLSATGMDDMPREDWILKRALADELLAENAANLRAQAESSDLDDDIVDSIHLAKQKRHTRPPRRHYPMLKHLESQESAEGEHATYAHETDVLTELADSTYVVKLAEDSDRKVPADIMDVDVVDSVRLEKTEREHTKGSKDHHVILRHLETQDSIVLEQAKHAHTDEFHRSTVETKMCSMTLSSDEDGNAAAAASSPQVRRDSNKQRLMGKLETQDSVEMEHQTHAHTDDFHPDHDHNTQGPA